MAYFSDLDPYSYGHSSHPGVVHIGWLDGVHPFPKGPVAPHLIERMKRLATAPVQLYRGRHICELCPPPVYAKPLLLEGRFTDEFRSWTRWAQQRSSNGEIRVAGKDVIYAAPVLIIHYIEEHSYLPPTEFLKAVAAF